MPRFYVRYDVILVIRLPDGTLARYLDGYGGQVPLLARTAVWGGPC